MSLPSEPLGVVLYDADDLRIELMPDREVAGDSILRAPMVLGLEVVGTVAHAAVDGQQTGRRYAGRGPPGRRRRHPARFPHTNGAFSQLRHPAQQDAEAAARRTQTPRC
jgi:hypothetical protein